MALTDGLLAYWRLDEASGTRYDSHGTNDLSATGAVGSAAGKLGPAADFGGSAQYLSGPIGLPAGPLTLACWAQAGSTGRTQWAMSCVSGSGTAVCLGQRSGGAWKAEGFGNSSDPNLSSGVTPSPGQWYHLAYTWDGTTGRIYTDGVERASGTTPPQGTAKTVAYVGAFNASFDWWLGQVDEAGIWTRALTGTEVGQLYNGGSGLAYPLTGGGGGGTVKPWWQYATQQVIGGL